MALDTNDYIGSFADENVRFTTEILHTVAVGDNYYKLLVFVENDRFVDVTDEAWSLIPGSTTQKCLVVNADNYATYTSGLLQSWLYDFFINGFTGDAILVGVGTKVDSSTSEADMTTFVEGLEKAYEIMKAYAYHKTICAGETDSILPSLALKLSLLCKNDEDLLSGAPYYPLTKAVLTGDTADPIYKALIADTSADAYMTYHSDPTHNGSLYSLGLALAENNETGTPVGNTIDMCASSNITASEDGVSPSTAVKTTLKNARIDYFKPVGNNTGEVAAEGGRTIRNIVLSAYWIKNYITYMTKVRVAELITKRNFRKNAAAYARIVTVMKTQLTKFSATGALDKLTISAPAFTDLPSSSGRSIVIPNAWSAYYVDNVNEVRISGTLYIGE